MPMMSMSIQSQLPPYCSNVQYRKSASHLVARRKITNALINKLGKCWEKQELKLDFNATQKKLKSKQK